MKKHTLIYDSECSLCVRFKKALEFADTESLIQYKSVYDASVYVDFPELTEEDCEVEIHFITNEGKVLRGGDVIAYLVTILPAVKKFSWLVESNSAKKAMDAFYGQLNDMRLMKRRKCFTCGRGQRK